MRYLLPLLFLGFAGCASKHQGVSIKLISGMEVDELTYSPPETLEADLRKAIEDDLDFEVERKLIPPGGLLVVKNSDSKSRYLLPADFTYSMLISSVILESEKGRYFCEDVEIKESYILDNGVHSVGGSLRIGPASSHQRNKTAINCPINKAIGIPFLIKLVGFKGDTAGVYSVQRRE